MMSDTFFETPFPADEPLILTQSARRLLGFGKLLLLQEKPHTTIGLVTGQPGTGKTSAAHMLRQQIQLQYDSGGASCSYCRVPPQCTPTLLTKILYSSLMLTSPQPHSGQIKYRTTQSALSLLLSALQQPQKHLLIVNEVDLLHPACYDLLHHLFEETHCPLLLLGTPKLQIKLQQHVHFASDIGLHMTFAPPTEDEILQSILPQLLVSGWSFDPENDVDRQLGEKIWQAVKPSLRRLRTLLQTASLLANSMGDDKITCDNLGQALDMIAFPSQKHFAANTVRKDENMERDVFRRNVTRTTPKNGKMAYKEEHRDGSF